MGSAQMTALSDKLATVATLWNVTRPCAASNKFHTGIVGYTVNAYCTATTAVAASDTSI